MAEMLQTIKGAWKAPELRKKILFTVFILLIYRLGNAVPVPYVDVAALKEYFDTTLSSTVLGLYNAMSGSAFSRATVFALSIASLPATILAFNHPANDWKFTTIMRTITNTNGVLYAIVYFLLIIAFGYFYAAIQYNPIEIANNLKKNGGYIPGFRPGRPTAEFIQKVIHKIVLFGSLYLGVVAILPIIISNISGYSSLAIGGTSVIIVVGVALETSKALEAQMMMRNYKGFLE